MAEHSVERIQKQFIFPACIFASIFNFDIDTRWLIVSSG